MVWIARRLGEVASDRSGGVTGGRLAGTRGQALVTNGGDNVAGGEKRSRQLALAIFLAVGLAFAVVNVFSELDERERAGRPVDTWEPWCWELTSLASFLMLAPLIFRLSQWLHPPRLSWPAALAVHLLLSIPASLAHSLIMIGMRQAIYAALGGQYGYGDDDLGAVLLYEYRKDLISYAVLVALPHLARRLLEVRQSPGPPAGYRIEVRDGSRTRWLAPGDVDWAQAAGNYVELFGPFGTILHRRTLAALAEELRPHGFARIHRSRIVRRTAIASTETRPSGDFDVTLVSGVTIGGSRRYRGELA